MKKVVLSLLLLGFSNYYLNAQESVGGIPWSVSKKESFTSDRVSLVSLKTPDFEKALKEDAYNEEIGKPGKYRVALGVKTDINFGSGTLTYLNDGSMVWRLQVTVPTSVALKLQYEKFDIPKGVTYFVQNGKKTQLIGGFDKTSTYDASSMAHEAVQGDVANLEMNISPGVDLKDIQLDINMVYGLYRGASSITNDVAAVYGLGESDTCQVNINCPETAPWYRFTSAVAHIWITNADTAGASGGFCSGTLIGNTARDCKPYFLTASHCDGQNAYSSPHFRYWEFTFDFRAPLCAGGGKPNTSKVLKGADFKSRSYYTIPAGASTGPLYGDFLLLQLKDPSNKLTEWDRYLGGWDRRDLKTNNDTVWIGFHHPSGDVMKYTKFWRLDSMGVFNTDSTGTHWSVWQTRGGIQPGSSGSALWQGSTGRILGALSGGPTPTQANLCRRSTNNRSEYTKNSHNWFNEYDSTYYFNDTINETNSRLAPFLDPSNTGALTLDMMKANPCTIDPFTLSINDKNLLSDGVFLYPNPSTGIVTMTVNLEKSKDLTIEVINVLGQKQNAYLIKNASLNQTATFDLSNYANGIYLFKISDGNTSTTKKVILRK